MLPPPQFCHIASLLLLVGSRGRWLLTGLAIITALAAGNVVSAHGDLDARIRELRTALEENPDDAALHFELATAYSEHEEWENALATAERVDALAPGEFVTGVIRGRALAGLGRHAEARVLLREAVVLHPERTELLLDRARVFAALGEAEPSLADYRAFLARHERPSPEMALESVGAITAAGHPREAQLALEAVTRRIGAYPVIEQAALQLALSLEDFDDALRHIEALQRMAPRPEPWMAERAAVLARAGRRGEAREAWQALLRHIDALPTLRRGVRDMRRLADHARTQLAGLAEPESVP